MSISISEKSLFTDYERIFLNRMRVARIATIDPEDNFPHLVPICYVLDNDLVYTSLSKNSKRLSNLNKTSEVSLLFDEYQEKNAVWLVLRGILLKAKVEILSYNEHSENFMRGWTKLIEKYPQYKTWAHEDLTPNDPGLRRIMQIIPIDKVSWGFP